MLPFCRDCPGADGQIQSVDTHRLKKFADLRNRQRLKMFGVDTDFGTLFGERFLREQRELRDDFGPHGALNGGFELRGAVEVVWGELFEHPSRRLL